MRHRRRFRVVEFEDQIEICGVVMKRFRLPDGRRAFEEGAVRALLLDTLIPATPEDYARFDAFTQPEARH